MKTVLFCPFDGTSKIAGTKVGAEKIRESFLGSGFLDLIKGHQLLRLETQNSAIYCRELERLVTERSDLGLVIGGEHLITFPVIRALSLRHPDLRLIVLDAHHDAYEYPVSTHYSVFYHLFNELHIPTLILGVRYQPERAIPGIELLSSDEVQSLSPSEMKARVCAFLGNAPFYFSLDLDVLDPGELSAVSAPVAGGLPLTLVQSICSELRDLRPLCCDIVEYNGIRDIECLELEKLRGLFRGYYEWTQNA